MQQVLLISVVLVAAYLFYIGSPPSISAMGGKIYPPIFLIVAGTALVIVHIGADAFFGVDPSQTWRGLALEEISLLIPVTYGLIAGGLAIALRDGFRRARKP